MEYSEHAKILKIQDRMQAAKNFLTWLTAEKGFFLCEPEYESKLADFIPVTERIEDPLEDLLAEYFEIDRGKLEQENQDMLTALKQEAAHTDQRP